MRRHDNGPLLGDKVKRATRTLDETQARLVAYAEDSIADAQARLLVLGSPRLGDTPQQSADKRAARRAYFAAKHPRRA
jgi:hypothetical protein